MWHGTWRAKRLVEEGAGTETHAPSMCTLAYPAAARPEATSPSVMPWYSASEIHPVVALSVQSSVLVLRLHLKISHDLRGVPAQHWPGRAPHGPVAVAARCEDTSVLRPPLLLRHPTHIQPIGGVRANALRPSTLSTTNNNTSTAVHVKR